jgi:uncharacterized protein (TIGR03437 family)
VFGASGALPVPAYGIYLGIRADPSLAANQEGAIEIREGPAPNGINRPFALHLSYYAWTDLANELSSSGVFTPDSTLAGDIAHGRIPVLSWQCDSSVANSDHVIAGGNPAEDAVIMATAKALAQYPGPVFLRWMWEFNDLANHNTCLGWTSGTPTPQIYNDFIGAWQHIWDLFQGAGATNVVFLWNASGGSKYAPDGFYPGNAYVDWIGVDTYQRSETETFDDDFGSFYTTFSQSPYGNKPLMVGENGSQDYAQYNVELQWTYLQGLLADVQANRYPLLKAYDYFDAGSPPTWVLDDNNGQGNGGLAAFVVLGASPLFSATAITLAANAEGHAPVIAPNTWVEIKGIGLAPAGDSRIWKSSDFVNNQMPTKLDGVGVTVNGKNAYIYYISSTQVNILTPPDAMQGAVNVVLTNNGIASPPFTVQAQTLSPSFFVFNGGPYIAATHANGSYLGPTTIYPGATTPAKPGEVVTIYANGFGQTTASVVSGSINQGGTLSPIPVVKIGGIAATVQYAGLVAPGEFQFNVVVPSSLGNGDQTITAIHNGSATQAGTLITVQQ